jgi:hypothetical protein
MNLALDVRDMRAATNLTLKRNIFEYGQNALPLTLAGLSSDASKYDAFPMYNIYKYAFYELGILQEQDTPGYFDQEPVEVYANSLVHDLFQLNRTRIEADSAVVFNVVMACWGSLWTMLQTCEMDSSNSQNMTASLDTAVALWIGTGQVRASNVQGYMLYNLAERMGTSFVQDSSSGESLVNMVVLETFVSLKTSIQSGKCMDAGGYIQMRANVQKLIKLTNTILVQVLLQQVVVTDDSDFMELYSLAILPQIAACNTSAYTSLRQMTVTESITVANKPLIISALQSVYSCLLLDCQDVGAYENGRIPQCTDAQVTSLGGYAPATDIRKKAYIDRDVRHIRMFMRIKAYEAVKDYYKYGWNTNFSLKDLATNNFSPATSVEFSRFQSYFTNANFTESILMSVLNKAAPFDTASDEDRTYIVARLLEGVVMYYSITSELESAISVCGNANATAAAALPYWDGGAAFYVGSLQGDTEELEHSEQMLFGLAKSLCSDFNTCETTGSAVNSVLMKFLNYGRNSISNKSCQEALTILNSSIKPYLIIPLVQAVVYYAKMSDQNSTTGNNGALYAFSRAVLPLMNQANQVASTELDSQTNYLSGRTPDLSQVFDAFRTALGTMGTDCQKVGQISIHGVLTGVCVGDASVPVLNSSATRQATNTSTPTTPIKAIPPPDPSGIAWGRYTFENETIGLNDSVFSLDIKNMAMSSNVTIAEAIYQQQSAYSTNGLTGDAGINSLSDFSTKAITLMMNDPLYNFYRIAFYDDSEFDKSPGEQNFPFGDTVVTLALTPEKGNSPQLGAEAAVVMNIFMMIAHRLYDSVRQCKQMSDGVPMIDSAVGLWIGREQGQGAYDSGWMMYSRAQEAAKLYGKPTGEAAINTKLMDLFNQAQAIAKTCVTEPNAHKQLQQITDSIIRTMSSVSLQLMLAHISVKNQNNVELYALAFIPQAVACDIKAYENLRNTLFLNFNGTNGTDTWLITGLGKVLRCLRITCEDLGDTSNASPELKNLVSVACSELNALDTATTLAGYQTSYNVSELARIDLDAQQIELFMRAKSYDLAIDYYMNGRNSLDVFENPVSLQSLATDANRTDANETFTLFQGYFKSSNYSDSITMQALLGNESGYGIFASASRLQHAEGVSRSLQTMVPYMQIVAKLRSAIQQCKTTQSGQKSIDQAAALFVGSIEGPALGGDPDGGGRMLFALAKEMCTAFGECADNNDASINEFILVSLSDMKRSIDAKDCVSAATIAEDTLALLPVPLVQATLKFAAANVAQPARSQEPSLAAGYIVANAVLPLVVKANGTSAATIFNNMDFNLNSKPVSDGAAAIFEAFRGALDPMMINCNLIGFLQVAGLDNLSVCNNVGTINVNTSTDLGTNLYVTTTNVQDLANIALDVKAMSDALSVGREALARIIYEEGANSPIYDASGAKVDLRSLEGFSVNASQIMTLNPLYQIAVFALRDTNGMYLGQDAGRYADTIVQQAMTEGAAVNSPIGAEAAVVLNLWMELVNELFETVNLCKNRKIFEADGIRSMDEAAAYWIGDGQTIGNSVNGHLLYALAEQMGDFFSTVDKATNQSVANVNILQLFYQAKIELSLTGACAADITAQRLRHIVNKIVTQMLIVNAQALIHFLRVSDRPRVRIYAHAFVPFIVGCSPETFSYLRGKLIDYTYTEMEVDSIVQTIRSMFSCFNIECADVGVHASESNPPCGSLDDNYQLAGYRASTNISDFAKLDLDIAEMDILMKMEAFEAAEDLYTYGKHSTQLIGDGTGLSLGYLAGSLDRTNVPQFFSFKKYYGEDDKYADTIIRYAMMSNNQLTPDQRRLVATATSQYIILYMAALQSMHQAVDACDAGDQAAGEHWDTAAAWLIGHMEGTTEAGSNDGRLLWALAKSKCDEFGTCSTGAPGSARFNDELVLRLYTGRGSVMTKGCSQLRQVTDQVTALLPIPLIQSAVSTAFLLKHASGDQQGQLLALGYVYSQALLPLITNVNSGAAATIASSFDLVGGKSIPHGVPALVSAYSSVLSGMGINCASVGGNNQVDMCTGVVKRTGLAVGLTFMFLVLIAGAGACFWRRRRRRKANAENNPVFVESKGTLDHDDFVRKPSEDWSCGPSEAEHSDAHANQPSHLVLDDNQQLRAEEKKDDDEEDDDDAVQIV